jgi:hypothetical protein
MGLPSSQSDDTSAPNMYRSMAAGSVSAFHTTSRSAEMDNDARAIRLVDGFVDMAV